MFRPKDVTTEDMILWRPVRNFKTLQLLLKKNETLRAETSLTDSGSFTGLSRESQSLFVVLPLSY